jgi:hypothetical protein
LINKIPHTKNTHKEQKRQLVNKTPHTTTPANSGKGRCLTRHYTLYTT